MKWPRCEWTKTPKAFSKLRSLTTTKLHGNDYNYISHNWPYYKHVYTLLENSVCYINAALECARIPPCTHVTQLDLSHSKWVGMGISLSTCGIKNTFQGLGYTSLLECPQPIIYIYMSVHDPGCAKEFGWWSHEDMWVHWCTLASPASRASNLTALCWMSQCSLKIT